MKNIVYDKYINANRNGEGLDVFIDFPKHLLHMKQNEKGGQYFLMYFSDIERAQFEKSCKDENIITIYDNSYFEYKIEGKTPSMDKYANDIACCNPDIVMADVYNTEYNERWSEWTARTLCNDDTLLMAIPHGDTIEDVADMIYNMNYNRYISIIGIPYQFNGFTRADIIAYCVANGKWCWDKAVHMLGLSDANEVQHHRDLIRICYNIISIDTSFPVLVGCVGDTLTVDANSRFLQEKPIVDIVNCPTHMTDENIVTSNIKCFNDTISKVTSGYAKIALVGAAGTGKTTLANVLADRLRRSRYVKYPPIHEVCDYRGDLEHANLATCLYTGCNIMAATIDFHETAILDRCLIDNIAYAIFNSNDTQVSVFTLAFNMFCGDISSISWTYPLENCDIEDDGKRITDKGIQAQIHERFAETMTIVDLSKQTLVALEGNLSVEDRLLKLLLAI